jgi:hypothetical protein
MPRVYLVVHDADRHELERGQLIRMSKESATSDSITYGLRDDHSHAIASQLLAPLSSHRLSRPCLSLVMAEDVHAGDYDDAPKLDPSFEEAYNEGVELVDEHNVPYLKDPPNGKDYVISIEVGDGTRGEIKFSGDGKRILSLVYACSFASLMASVDMHECPDDDDDFPGEVREDLLDAMNLVSVTERTAAFIGASLNVPVMDLIGPKSGKKSKGHKSKGGGTSKRGKKEKSARKKRKKAKKSGDKKKAKKYKRREKKQRAKRKGKEQKKEQKQKKKADKKKQDKAQKKADKKAQKGGGGGGGKNDSSGGGGGGGKDKGGKEGGGGGGKEGGGGGKEGGGAGGGGKEGEQKPQPQSQEQQQQQQGGGGGGSSGGGGGNTGNVDSSGGSNQTGPVFAGGGPPVIINQPTPIYIPVANTIPPPGTVVYILPPGVAPPPGATTVLLPPTQQTLPGATAVYLPSGAQPPIGATTTTIISSSSTPLVTAASSGIVDNIIPIESLRIEVSIFSRHFDSEVERHLITALHQVWNDQAWKHYQLPYPQELDAQFRQTIRAMLPMRSVEDAEDLIVRLVETLNERMVADIVSKVRSGAVVPRTSSAGDPLSSDDDNSGSDDDDSSGSEVEPVKAAGDRRDRELRREERFRRREERRAERRHYGYGHRYGGPPPAVYGVPPPGAAAAVYSAAPPPTYSIAAKKDVVAVGVAQESDIEDALKRVEELVKDPKGFDPLLEETASGTIPYAVYASERKKQLASTLGLSSWQTLDGEPGWNESRQQRLDKAMKTLYQRYEHA